MTPPLSALSEAQRARAFERFELLRPCLDEGAPWCAWPAIAASPSTPSDAGPVSIAGTGSPASAARGEATGAVREVIRARSRRRRELRRTIQERRQVVESLLEARRGCGTEGTPGETPAILPGPQWPGRPLKRYADD